MRHAMLGTLGKVTSLLCLACSSCFPPRAEDSGGLRFEATGERALCLRICWARWPDKLTEC